MDLLFIGLIFVGVTLSIKVITEGKSQVEAQKDKLTQYQCAIQLCIAKTEAQERKTREALAIVEKLELELNAIKSKCNKVRNNIKHVKSQSKRMVI